MQTVHSCGASYQNYNKERESCIIDTDTIFTGLNKDIPKIWNHRLKCNRAIINQFCHTYNLAHSSYSFISHIHAPILGQKAKKCVGNTRTCGYQCKIPSIYTFRGRNFDDFKRSNRIQMTWCVWINIKDDKPCGYEPASN